MPCISLYHMVYFVPEWYCMVLYRIALYCTVSYGILCYPTPLHGIACCCVVGFGAQTVSRKTAMCLMCMYNFVFWLHSNIKHSRSGVNCKPNRSLSIRSADGLNIVILVIHAMLSTFFIVGCFNFPQLVPVANFLNLPTVYHLFFHEQAKARKENEERPRWIHFCVWLQTSLFLRVQFQQ